MNHIFRNQDDLPQHTKLTKQSEIYLFTFDFLQEIITNNSDHKKEKEVLW